MSLEPDSVSDQLVCPPGNRSSVVIPMLNLGSITDVVTLRAVSELHDRLPAMVFQLLEHEPQVCIEDMVQESLDDLRKGLSRGIHSIPVMNRLSLG